MLAVGLSPGFVSGRSAHLALAVLVFVRRVRRDTVGRTRARTV